MEYLLAVSILVHFLTKLIGKTCRFIEALKKE
jgi:hypothetical protein